MKTLISVILIALFASSCLADGIGISGHRKAPKRPGTSTTGQKSTGQVIRPTLSWSEEITTSGEVGEIEPILPLAHADISFPPLSGSNLNGGLDVLTGPLVARDSRLPWFALALIPVAVVPFLGPDLPRSGVLPPNPSLPTHPLPESQSIALFAAGLFVLGWAGRGRLWK